MIWFPSVLCPLVYFTVKNQVHTGVYCTTLAWLKVMITSTQVFNLSSQCPAEQQTDRDMALEQLYQLEAIILAFHNNKVFIQ